MISFLNVSVKYDKNHGTALNKVNLDVDGGKVVVVGANGSGKTTMIKVLLGLAPLTSGKVMVGDDHNRDLRDFTELGTNLQEVYNIARGTVTDLMDLWGKLKGKSNSDLKARISDYGLEDTLRKYLHNLSTGQRKMVCNLLATSFNARTILLDEPFENVDQSKRVKFLKEIIAMDCEIIMVTHEIHLLRYLKGWTLYFMVDGSLWGKFNAVDVERIYISRGRVENAVVSFNTELGEVSITMDQGGMQLVRAGSLSNALEGVAMDAF